VVELEGVSCGFDRFCSILDDSPAIVRTLPSYVEIEITGKANGRCVYSPLPLCRRNPDEMSVEQYKDVLDIILDFAGKLHVSISYLGEPLLHPDIRKIIELSLERKDVNLIIETDGIQCTPPVSDFIAGLASDNLSVIFEVDAVLEGTYKMVRDGEIGVVERNIRYLLSKTVRNVYVQFVRMDSNEDEMLKFFDQSESEGAKVIIQKFNSYLGLLPVLSSSDLTPLERMPCWHLQRDLVVFGNGDIPRCKQDINGEILLGNIFTIFTTEHTIPDVKHN
jgi:spiro-SPASM protein